MAVRATLRAALPFLAVLVAAGALGYDRIRGQDEVVLYLGERRPLSEAGSHVCHSLNLPEVRCFDSWDGVLDDMKEHWPRNYASLLKMLESTGWSPAPGAPP